MTDENLTKWKILQQKVFEQRICRAFELFRRNHIEPVLIKGWAAARNYPATGDRLYTDIDLAVSKFDFEKASKIIAGEQLYVDLHSELRHLDTRNWNELFNDSRLITIEDCAGCSIRVLSAEDHLRVMCVHWLNDGGAHRERLWDIYYAVANRPADFDWEKCLETVSVKRKKWILCAVKLAEQYLGLDVAGIPALEAELELPRWLTETVEKEWSSPVKLKPFTFFPLDPKNLYQQLRIRIPPNPVQATIEMDREFDGGTRKLIQLENIVRRFKQRLKK